TYYPNRNWEIKGIVANGWQRIQRVEGNSMLSYGTAVTYQNEQESGFNWSTFVTTEDPDTARRIRLFNNLYGKWNRKSWRILAGFDHGLQQTEMGSSNWHSWYGATFIAQKEINRNIKSNMRLEYYNDPNEVIVQANGQGFGVFGLSFGFDCFPEETIALRFEARHLLGNEAYFVSHKGITNSNWVITSSLSFKLWGQLYLNQD
ncbi:MAG: outer membrane beta-barrel protein, partial [Bacteroidetes bacterium]|nr:outer membrane beta-barrel protein [Bacteroidota bacterium]